VSNNSNPLHVLTSTFVSPRLSYPPTFGKICDNFVRCPSGKQKKESIC
jgi:hypothetical protein